jgi:hypothetical protein
VSAATSIDAGATADEPGTGPGGDLEGRSTPTPVVVRRNAGLAALVGAAASAIAIAYLWRATQSGAPLDWVLCLALTGIAVLYLTQLVDARTPLLVADELGVRIRLGNQWRGLPWDAVGTVHVQPRRGLLRDGRLMFVPHSLGRALDGLDSRGRRAAALNQKLYGAALAVPIGLTTRVSAQGQELSDDLDALARSRTEIVALQPVPDRQPAPTTPTPAEASRSAAPPPAEASGSAPWTPAEASGSAPWTPVVPAQGSAPDLEDARDGADEEPEGPRPGRRALLGTLGTVVSRAARGRRRDVDADTADPGDADHPADDPDATPGAAAEPEPEGDAGPDVTLQPAARSAAVPLRTTRHAARAQITRDLPATVLGTAALLPEPVARARAAALPESRELRRPAGPESDRPGWPSDDGVRPIARLGDPVDALVVDDFVVEPAYDPVIGPELMAARTRVGLSVDELAERTRIRPHVIESIEVDDFAPCGGDFYARGHLRTLSRVLGRDPVPLLEHFDNRYATAPINARRVFEAELATGMKGSVRSTVGGPNWALLVGVVLALVMTWGVVRLFASEPAELLSPVAPTLNGSAGVDDDGAADSRAVAVPPKPLRLTLVGAQEGTRVVVRDRSGKVVWAGRLAPDQRQEIQATPPVKVRAEDAGAVEATVDGADRGAVGPLGDPATRTFRHPAAR